MHGQVTVFKYVAKKRFLGSYAADMISLTISQSLIILVVDNT